jgi:DNA repair exonuclease SbcCD ATPase subunit
MNVKTLHLEHFMCYENIHLDFPEKGIVIVTGDNGSGKSAIAEGIAYGLHHKTLRGTDPWSSEDSTKGCVKLITYDGFEVTRQRIRYGCPRVQINWTYEGQEHESILHKKEQDAIEAVIGSWDMWRRSSAFSSSDVAHFSLATDAEQKRLIESMLGLGIFDPAVDMCRRDMKMIERDLEKQKHKVEMLTTKIESEQQRLSDAQAYIWEDMPDITAYKNDIARTEKLLETTRAEMTKLGNELNSKQSKVTREQVKADNAHADSQLLTKDACPTCHRRIGDNLRTTLTAKFDTVISEAQKAVSTYQAEGDGIRGMLDELSEDCTILASRLSDRKARLIAITNEQERAERVKTALATVRETIQRLTEEHTEATNKFDTLRIRWGTLKAAERVLGMSGVRVQVLANALYGLDAMAAVWLKKIAGDGISLSLLPYKQNKNDSITDKFTMTVEGAGGGNGYKGLSQGQRRRVDIAMLFALAELASASHGRQNGTLIVDEAFDSLDSEGTEAVIEAITEVSKDRCVLVITHNPGLALQLPADTRLRVENGSIHKV